MRKPKFGTEKIAQLTIFIELVIKKRLFEEKWKKFGLKNQRIRDIHRKTINLGLRGLILEHCQIGGMGG